MKDIKINLDLEGAWDDMVNRLTSWVSMVVLNLPNIFIAIVVFAGSLIISKYISRLVLRSLGRSSLQQSMKQLISKLVSISVFLMGLFLILGILDLSKTLNTILAGAGVAGLVVGLALQGMLANTYSGIVLSFIKNVKFGDWVESNGYEGEVVDINLRVVTLKQPDNNLVYIPNKLVIENALKNFSTTSMSRVILQCGVAYSSNLEQVRNLVLDTLMQNFDTLTERDDIIFLYKEFGDSSINFETRFWIDSTSALEVAKARTKAMIQIKKTFDANGINIPFPIRTLDIPKTVMEQIVPKQTVSKN